MWSRNPCFTLDEKQENKESENDLFEDLTHNTGQAHWTVVGNVFRVPPLEFWKKLTDAFQSTGTTAVARKLLNKSVKGSARKVAKHISHLGCRWSGPGLIEVSRVESSLWTMQGVTRDGPSSPMELTVLE